MDEVEEGKRKEPNVKKKEMAGKECKRNARKGGKGGWKAILY